MNTKRTLTILAFLAIYFIWGTTYLANLFGLQGMKPFVLSSLRYAGASTLLLVWCLIRRLAFPSFRQLKVLAISGLLMLGGGAGFVVIGEQYISSGHTAVVIATEPRRARLTGIGAGTSSLSGSRSRSRARLSNCATR